MLSQQGSSFNIYHPQFSSLQIQQFFEACFTSFIFLSSHDFCFFYFFNNGSVIYIQQNVQTVHITVQRQMHAHTQHMPHLNTASFHFTSRSPLPPLPRNPHTPLRDARALLSPWRAESLLELYVNGTTLHIPFCAQIFLLSIVFLKSIYIIM